MTTSKSISLLFAGYVALVVAIFGVMVNVVFFASWYGIISQQQPPPPKDRIQEHDIQDPAVQEIKLMKRLVRRPLMGMADPLIIQDPILLQKLQAYHNIINLVEYQDQIWHYRILNDKVMLISVDPLVDSQLLLIYITLVAAIILALISYWVSMYLVQRGLKPLHQLTQHINQTQDPTHYEHLIVGPDQDELQQVSTAFTDAMDTIAQQTNSLKNFVTHASHELKTPLMMISSSVDLMTKSGITNHQTQIIKQTTQSMKSLIDRLITSMRDDVIQMNQTDIDVLVHSVADRVDISYNHSHPLTMSITKHLIKDTDLMICESIIRNLLENAYKYAVPETAISITANMQQCIISNYIDPSQNLDLNLIWQPFYQGDVSHSDVDSYGLGLSIIKQYVDRMGWNIKAQIKEDVISFIIDWN